MPLHPAEFKVGCMSGYSAACLMSSGFTSESGFFLDRVQRDSALEKLSR
jgi:hypothetical protein